MCFDNDDDDSVEKMGYCLFFWNCWNDLKKKPKNAVLNIRTSLNYLEIRFVNFLYRVKVQTHRI